MGQLLCIEEERLSHSSTYFWSSAVSDASSLAWFASSLGLASLITSVSVWRCLDLLAPSTVHLAVPVLRKDSSSSTLSLSVSSAAVPSSLGASGKTLEEWQKSCPPLYTESHDAKWHAILLSDKILKFYYNVYIGKSRIERDYWLRYATLMAQQFFYVRPYSKTSYIFSSSWDSYWTLLH